MQKFINRDAGPSPGGSLGRSKFGDAGPHPNPLQREREVGAKQLPFNFFQE